MGFNVVPTTKKKNYQNTLRAQELLIYAKKTGQSPHSALQVNKER